jgi:azurin
MSHHASSDSDGPSIWNLLNKLLAGGFAATVLVLAGALVGGGAQNSVEQRQPKPAAPPAAPAPATAGAPAAGTVPAPAAPAVAADPSAPAIELVLKPDTANPMAFNTKELSAKAGQKIKLTFDNKGAIAPLQHNVIVGQAGSQQRLMALAMQIMTDPQGMAKGYIPEGPEILAHTKLVNPGQAETIEFVLPAPGDYPYICSFPGHSMIMNGVIKAQ